jgi:4-hydroxybutyrate dehydrogenase
MNQFSFPTTILLHGEGALAELSNRIAEKKLMLVTDPGLVKAGVVEQALAGLADCGAAFEVFDGVHPNPIEADVEAGTTFYNEHACDGLLALGGGSAMDVAKVIRFFASHPAPLTQYSVLENGGAKITGALPPFYAVPTTAGTGSEVGRGAVITLRDTGRKTLFVAPPLMPTLAVLEPALTAGLPPHLTAATGIDAFTHCLESYFAPVYHPMADGVALEGIRLCLAHLNTAVADGADLAARAQMQMAASMGAVAFQKDLGMVHSLAHPLSARHGMHHGLANALMLPDSMAFIEAANLTPAQQQRIQTIRTLFAEANRTGDSLAAETREWFSELGIQFGLSNHGIPADDLVPLADEAFADPCHATNLIPVTRDNLAAVYQSAL